MPLTLFGNFFISNIPHEVLKMTKLKDIWYIQHILFFEHYIIYNQHIFSLKPQDLKVKTRQAN